MATILERSNDSLILFQRLVSSEGLSRYENEVSLKTWKDEIIRLQVWIRNTSSVGDRLRDSSRLSSQIIKLLERFQELLEDLEKLLGEHSENSVYDGEHGEPLEEAEDDISDSTEIQNIHKMLREIIGYLNKMSAAILRESDDGEVPGTPLCESVSM
jgi:hypothetical protein